MNNIYRQKVELLLRILPFVTDEECFAIHGGTAINLFVKDLYRLSVDIDVTYIPIEDRNTSLLRINEALERISDRVKRTFRDVRVIPRLDISKITCESRGCQVKIEVNQTKRGLVCGDAILYPLCEKAQEMFGMEVDARIVSLPQLYGGKISAALSRQHPRDLFDIKQMDIPLTDVKEGLIFCLLGSDRPIHESFAPNLIDQHEAMERQFSGMSEIPFTYNDFEATREKLVNDVNSVMTEDDRRFLIGFEELSVDWENSPYSSFKEYPSVRWKMQNLQKLKASNPKKLNAEADKLRNIFGME
ncbi:nucleotidyl transferase AbiEii/AbiGii toxin family protein [Bacteroides acidifaciens]|jgi:predicted nucleotidyltransferase component of viral defense system|uniref:nucleotidyl transferase AbiEii/AbiGii toxin family protein n=1 Tax=Bacteroides acidifaciens TaxID=85831 RepID=UPI0015B624E7|nr:nucleotidyl transferase AbiEii/AbiGii toxin family protein [Bacteroides acidifaciens]MDO4179680.1 nucleotidyl transferase AbiEii/AbiGii toxin family protein [Bacteroidales bacterium]